MTLRMPTWDAERVAKVLENEKITEFTGFGEAWASDCAARIKAAVKAEKTRRETKRHCRTCKWIVGVKSINPNCVKHGIGVDPDATCCGQWRMWKV